MLIIEIDGGQHMEAVEYDQKRTEYLEAKGYRVVRFWNNDVFSSVQVVLETILYSLEDSG
jgi:very-short-patch-repair endonuclease